MRPERREENRGSRELTKRSAGGILYCAKALKRWQCVQQLTKKDEKERKDENGTAKRRFIISKR